MSCGRAALCALAAARVTSGAEGVISAQTETPDAPRPWLVRVPADATGIDFRHNSGHVEGRLPIAEQIGGSVALLDVDGDGDLDVFLGQAGMLPDAAASTTRDARAQSRLYRNDGGWKFTDITATALPSTPAYTIAVTVGDTDGDGDDDLYLSNLGPDMLWHNDGGRFVDATAAAGLGDSGLSASAALADIDGDGDLDLFVTRYLDWSPAIEKECRTAGGLLDYCSPASINAPGTAKLYRNQGNGTFEDISSAAGVAEARGTGLGVVSIDWNDDGRVDFFVANDGMPNRLWTGSVPDPASPKSSPHFSDRAPAVGCAIDLTGVMKAGMGVAVADLDSNGRDDLLITNMERQSDSVYLNMGTHFQDATARLGLAGPTRERTRWGVLLLDLDLDGDDDLFEACGRVQLNRSAAKGVHPLAEPDAVFERTENGRFARLDAGIDLGGAPIEVGRGAAAGDLDGDGDLDIVVANMDGPPFLLRNDAPTRFQEAHRWIGLDLRDAAGYRAIGARVTVKAGALTKSKTMRSGASYASASDPRLHFGLGSAVQVDSVEVRWPNGVVQSVGPLAAGQWHVIEQAVGKIESQQGEAP